VPLQCYSWQCHSNLYIFNNNNNNYSTLQWSLCNSCIALTVFCVIIIIIAWCWFNWLDGGVKGAWVLPGIITVVFGCSIQAKPQHGRQEDRVSLWAWALWTDLLSHTIGLYWSLLARVDWFDTARWLSDLTPNRGRLYLPGISCLRKIVPAQNLLPEEDCTCPESPTCGTLYVPRIS